MFSLWGSWSCMVNQYMCGHYGLDLCRLPVFLFTFAPRRSYIRMGSAVGMMSHVVWNPTISWSHKATYHSHNSYPKNFSRPLMHSTGTIKCQAFSCHETSQAQVQEDELGRTICLRDHQFPPAQCMTPFQNNNFLPTWLVLNFQA